MNTSIYLEYIANRFVVGGRSIDAHVHVEKLEDVDRKFDLVINCAGIGARELVQDPDLEPHRGQVAVVPRIEALSCAVVCADAPVMYAIARTNDCVVGSQNDFSTDLAVDRATADRCLD